MQETMKKKRLVVICAILAAAILAGVAVYAAGSYGSKEDPLVAKSYLDSVLKPELEKELKNELNEALSEVRSGSGDFSVLTLRSGQTVTCEVGCEILPRIGSVQAYGASAPAMLDTTSGSSVSSGAALTANHLYMVSIAGNGITATADNTYVLLSGGYTIK